MEAVLCPSTKCTCAHGAAEAIFATRIFLEAPFHFYYPLLCYFSPYCKKTYQTIRFQRVNTHVQLLHHKAGQEVSFTCIEQISTE